MAQHKNIDIVPDETITRVHLSQGDIGRTLIFYLFENALSWSVPASSTIKCQGTKPSGFGFSVNCTYSGNAVTCVTTEGMTDEFGQIEAELLITSSDESQIFGTSNFILDIERNPHPSNTEDGGADTAISLTARVTALETAVSELEANEGLTDAIKLALLQIAQKVAYIDANGQNYYDDLYDALYPPVELASISCVYTQSGTVYPTTSLDSLKSDLVVTAHMTDSSTSVVSSSAYTLSGTLSVGTSTVTVSYSGKTTTFNVTVTAVPTLSSISAVYTQSGTVYDTDSLDSLKSDLVVTAHYSDSSTSTVSSSDYTLSGTLTEGTSTITVTYGGQTATFNVTVTVKVTVTLRASLDDADNQVFTYNSTKSFNATGTVYSDDGVTDISSSITNNLAVLYQTSTVSNAVTMEASITTAGTQYRKTYVGSYDITNEKIYNAVALQPSNTSSAGTYTVNVDIKAGQRIIFFNMYQANPYTTSSHYTLVTATYEE